MITADEATQVLITVSQGTYNNTTSHSCVNEFALSYPKKELPPFIPDGFPKQVGTGTRDRT